MSRTTLESALRVHLLRRNIRHTAARLTVRALIGRTIAAMRGAA